MKCDHANVTLHEISHEMTFDLSFFTSVPKRYIKIKSLHYLFSALKELKSEKKDSKCVGKKKR